VVVNYILLLLILTPVQLPLTPNTSYIFTQRIAETATHLASPTSPSATFSTTDGTAPTYTITASVNNTAWGTITPYGEMQVEEGSNIIFYITPNSGYMIDNVLVNGVSQGAITTYTFSNVQSNGTISVIFKEGVGIDETALARSIRIYPNPTTGQLIIDNGQLTIDNVEVFDVYGRKLLSYPSLMSPETTINISHLSAGVYFLRIVTEQGETVRRVLKE